MPWFPPELREARREFEWADAGELPELVELDDLRGDLHMHTTETDGKATLEEMVAAARKRGLKYIAITDHSKRVTMARGLDAERLRAQWKRDRQAEQAAQGLSRAQGHRGRHPGERRAGPGRRRAGRSRLGRGQRPLRPESAARADHAARARRAGESLCLGDRPSDGPADQSPQAYEIDLDAVFKAAREHGKMLELNANPARLDLDDVACAAAKSLGVPIVISTDAHSTAGLDVMRYGILQARRGGLTKADVANTRPLDEFLVLVRAAASGN